MGVVIKIQVSRETVLYQAKIQTYYVGDARKDDKLMDIATKMQASDENDDVLNQFADGGANKVLDILTPLLGDVALTNEAVVKDGTQTATYEYSMDVPPTFDGNQNKAIQEGATNFITNWIIYEWLSLVYPEMAKIFFEKCGIVESELRHRINMRTKPVRRTVPPMS